MNFKSIGVFAFVSVTSLYGAGLTPPAKYQPLTGEGRAGSAFIVLHENVKLAVMSRHQFDGKTPGKVESADGGVVQLDRAKVFTQSDVQVLPVRLSTGSLSYLKYDGEFVLRANEEVAILGPSGDLIKGVIKSVGSEGGTYKSVEGPRVFEVETSQAFTAQGGSGGPIIQLQTGAVIGVLLSADHPQQARHIQFETLCLPKGGVATKAESHSSAASLDSLAKSRILPAESEQFRLGMKIEDLVALRPMMSRGGPGLRGTEQAETVSSNHLFGIVGVTVRQGQVVVVSWECSSTRATATDVVNTLRWLMSIYGPPQRAFLRDLNNDKREMEQTAYLWNKPDMIIKCSFHFSRHQSLCGSLEYYSKIFSPEDALYSAGAVELPLKENALIQNLINWTQNAFR